MAGTGRLAVLLLCLVASAAALQFEFDSGDAKCLSEELEYDVLIVGTFSVSQSFGAQTMVRVEDPVGRIIWSDNRSGEGSFAFTTDQMGSYRFCFQSAVTNGVMQRHTANLDLKVGVDAEDYDAIASKEHLDPLELELRKLEDAAVAINKHMTYMRQREAAMRNTNESTNARVLWLSVLSLIVLVALGAWQIYYLKKYFEAKKLI